jgi:type IV pilus assembly protein PilE
MGRDRYKMAGHAITKDRAEPIGGFTLIELVVVVAIVAILASIAFPSYREQIARGRRTDAQTALTDLANRLQRYYADTNTFATATIAAGNPTTDVLSGAQSPRGYYILQITASTSTAYTISAVRNTTGLQANDRCGDFTLSSTGIRGIANQAAGMTAPACWD